MQLTRLMVPQSKWNIKCPFPMDDWDDIAVHNTANKASAFAEISYMVGNNNQVSYHYAIDDYQIVQGVEENRNTWNAGDGTNGRGNRRALSIEICHSTNPDLKKFEASERLAAKFIAFKLKEKGKGIECVHPHQFYSGKYCPHKTLDLGWERFLDLIRAELGQLQTSTPTQSTSEKIATNYTVKINTADLNVRAGAGVNYKINTVVHQNEVYTIVAESNGWGKLKSGAGWIKLSYTKRTDTTSTTTTSSNKYDLGLYVVNASGLNVRSGPGANYAKKKIYAKGTKFDTYEIKNNWARTPSRMGMSRLLYTCKKILNLTKLDNSV